MKKIVLLMAIALGIIYSGMAQKAHFGVRLGVANPGYYGSDYTKAKENDTISAIWTPTAGIYINSLVSDYFWLKTEFNFVNRGFTHKDFYGSGKTLRNNYYFIDVYPCTPAFHFKGAQIFAGPSISILITSNRDSVTTGGDMKKISDSDLEGFNRYDIGFVAGVEYEFNFGLNLGVRMVRGFTSLYTPQDNTGIRTEWFNQTLMFSLGYSIGRTNASKKATENL